jgi:hypothetical protein
MVILAANITKETQRLIDDLLATDAFVKFALQNILDLSDTTILIRLAIINLLKQLPKNEDVQRYKAALLRPFEFDIFLKKELEDIKNME